MGSSRAIYDLQLTPGMGYLGSQEGQAAFERVLQHDEEPCQRVIVNVVGEPRNGKTSLCNMLTDQPFNPHETSTVGMKQNLVTTSNVAENWSVIKDSIVSNVNEFTEILCNHVIHFMDLKKPATLSLLCQSAICFLKIFSLTFIVLAIHYAAMGQGYGNTPYFGVILVVMFVLSGALFGSKDGFGIAIGVYDLALLSDYAYRRELYKQCESWEKEYGIFLASFFVFCYYALTDFAFISLPTGAALGTGMAIPFCYYKPPHIHDISVYGVTVMFQSHYMTFLVSVLIGLATWKQFKYKAFLVFIVCIIPCSMLSGDRSLYYIIVSGFGAGFSHAVFLKYGFKVYLWLKDGYLDPKLSSFSSTMARRLRRYVTYVFGLIYGALLAFFFGWEWPGFEKDRLCSTVSFLFLIELLHTVEDIKKTTVDKTVRPPVKNPCINTKMDSKMVKVKNLGVTSKVKIVLRDFAGHPLYRYTHHMFMTCRSFYVVVFNLKKAVTQKSLRKEIKKLVYWLNAINVHPSSHEFGFLLVGTHRDDVAISEIDLAKVGQNLINFIPIKYHDMIIWNEELPFFPVENSLPKIESLVDVQHNKLRLQLLNCGYLSTSTTNKKTWNWPLRYFSFYSTIQFHRTNGDLVVMKETLLKSSMQNTCFIKDNEDLHEMLSKFHDIGEIILYGDVVIFDPQAIVDVMAAFVTVPSKAEQSRQHLSQDWERLSTSGLASDDLVRRVLQTSLPQAEDVVQVQLIQLMEMYDLLCRIELANASLYCVLPLLSNDLPVEKLWKTASKCVTVYISLGDFNLEPVFLKLLCHCIRHDTAVNLDYIQFCKTIGIFVYQNQFPFKVQHIHVKSGQTTNTEMIKLSVNLEEGLSDDASEVINMIHSHVLQIIRNDFKMCSYSMGPACPFQNTQDTQVGFHLMELSKGPSQPCPQETPLVCHIHKSFVHKWKASHGVLVNKNVYHDTDISTIITSQRMISQTNDQITDLALHKLAKALGYDWKSLAFELGFQKSDIEFFSMDNSARSMDAVHSMLIAWRDTFDGQDHSKELRRALKNISKTDLAMWYDIN